jgi:hypothetical protein
MMPPQFANYSVGGEPGTFGDQGSSSGSGGNATGNKANSSNNQKGNSPSTEPDGEEGEAAPAAKPITKDKPAPACAN